MNRQSKSVWCQIMARDTYNDKHGVISEDKTVTIQPTISAVKLLCQASSTFLAESRFQSTVKSFEFSANRLCKSWGPLNTKIVWSALALKYEESDFVSEYLVCVHIILKRKKRNVCVWVGRGYFFSKKKFPFSLTSDAIPSIRDDDETSKGVFTQQPWHRGDIHPATRWKLYVAFTYCFYGGEFYFGIK